MTELRIPAESAMLADCIWELADTLRLDREPLRIGDPVSLRNEWRKMLDRTGERGRK